MVDHEVEKIIAKVQKLRALRHARERVRQLERELNGEPAKPEGPRTLPEFLRQHSPLRVV
jgi:predicted component of type VI protein secretion system